jgi:nucleoside-diphosphate-sugar epimerase
LKVVVTGGAGRLGRSVVTTLTDLDHEVVSVDRSTDGLDPRATGLTTDLSTNGAAAAVFERVRPDAVVHLAAIPAPFVAPEATILRTNVLLAYDVCAAAVAADVRSVVVASSPTVIGYGNPAGWAPNYLPIDEDHPVAPWHAYSLSKVTAEQVVATFANQVGDRVHLSAVRPCYVVAPEDWAGAPTQAGHTIRERLDRPELAAVSLFNYVDARDVAALMAILIDPPNTAPNGDVFFAGADDALAREPLADLLPRYIPSTAPFAAALTDGSPAFSTAKARRLLGWKPERSWRTELA